MVSPADRSAGGSRDIMPTYIGVGCPSDRVTPPLEMTLLVAAA